MLGSIPARPWLGNFDADTDPVVAESLKGVPPAQAAAADDATRKVVDALSQQHGWGTLGSASFEDNREKLRAAYEHFVGLTKRLPRELMFRKAQRFSPRTGDDERLLSDRLGRATPESMTLGRTQLPFKAHIVSYLGAATLITKSRPRWSKTLSR